MEKTAKTKSSPKKSAAAKRVAPVAPVIISSCLTGLCTRHDGGHAENFAALKAAGSAPLIPVCPEQLGGMPTPRAAAWITKGDGNDVLDGKARVVDTEGRDVTANFLLGAEEALKVAHLAGATEAVLKEKSPSCGNKATHRNGKAVKGMGVTAAMLRREGIKVKGF